MDTNQKQNHLQLSSDVTQEDYLKVCQGLIQYNVDQTHSLLNKPGVEIKLVLKDDRGEVFGGIYGATFLYCLYIDVLWVDDRYRGAGYGKLLMEEAECIARKNGCTFAHTTTFSYQSPDFYKHLGYEVFGVLEEYPQNIKQYFLKKRL